MAGPKENEHLNVATTDDDSLMLRTAVNDDITLELFKKTAVNDNDVLKPFKKARSSASTYCPSPSESTREKCSWGVGRWGPPCPAPRLSVKICQGAGNVGNAWST